ncbi:MAG: hypothetical protein KOO60_10845 [Gemmatimonadales bacterium]|nr:hypothetical protein [Gemmatimonadales bacterium]
MRSEHPTQNDLIAANTDYDNAIAERDRYEKALREIRVHPAIDSYMVLRDIAREALGDDTE